MSATRSSMLHAAIQSVAEVCPVARQVQQTLGRIKQITKDDFSPVTVADFAVQALIAVRLRDALGALAMIGEESAADLQAHGRGEVRQAVTAAVRTVRPDLNEDDVLAAIDLGNHDGSERAYWTLDPIDGTKGFLRGGQYAVSLAYIEDGEVVIGVLGCPNLGSDFARPFDQPDALGTLFFAALGEGAYAVSPAQANPTAGTRLSVARDRRLRDMRVCQSVEAAHSRLDETQRIAAHLKATGRPAQLDSQCKYAVVARNQADAYIRLPTRADYVEKIWDHAAGALIASEAGARVSDIHGLDLDFTQGATLKRNRGVVCAVPEFHGPILAAIADLYD